MQVPPIRTPQIPPFMGVKRLRKVQIQEKNIEYVKKWGIKNDNTIK